MIDLTDKRIMNQLRRVSVQPAVNWKQVIPKNLGLKFALSSLP